MTAPETQVSPPPDELEDAQGEGFDAEHTAPDAAVTEEPGNFVPAWLAALVLVLLLAVMGVGGYVVRGVVAGESRVADVADQEIVRWRAEVRADPKDTNARVSLGYAYQQAGRLDKAVDEYETVLKTDARNTAALYNLGVVYLRLGVDDRAEKVLWQTLDVVPDHVLAARTLGELYLEREQYRSLLKAVRPVVETRPEIADLQYLTGVAYEYTGHPDWAIARYRLALQYAPDYARAREGLERLGETP
ncbi:MAG: tetratricopeptide repeat protein [Coriobacteriia bacterium]|nr:tetratricopeptide repeat protein [Coriobacteriia bacterium]